MTMHCTMADLLALRDGEGSAAAQHHLTECEACRVEFERLHQRVAALKALPALRPPRDRWSAVRATIATERRRRRRLHITWGSLAAAAAAALVVGVQALRVRTETTASAVDLRALVEQSQRLEEALRTYDPTSRVLNGRAASAVAELEDRIAVIDLGLAEAQSRGASRDELLELWRQRVQLMDELVRVHVTRAAYVGL
jgi:predicted anti-sigma-YlaC factor YlaD